MLSIKIKQVSKVNNQGNRYNLEIEGNNNYFANNILVHNCRCLAFLEGGSVILQSRQHKRFNHLDHLRSELLPILQTNPTLVFDGELYSHKYTFQEIISAVKRDDANSLTGEVEYHVYDLITPGGFSDRFKLLKSLVGDQKFIKLVDAPLIQSSDQIEDYHKKWTAEGYEGVMIRNSAGEYKQDGRSQDLLKYKKFLEEDFKIVGATQNKGKLVNTCTFKCECNGTTFDCICEGTQEEREQLWADWQRGAIKVGDVLSVRFFSWSTSKNKTPRFPVGKVIRSYE